MLPRPKYFEKLPNSGYLASRAEVIVGAWVAPSCRNPDTRTQSSWRVGC